MRDELIHYYKPKFKLKNIIFIKEGILKGEVGIIYKIKKEFDCYTVKITFKDGFIKVDKYGEELMMLVDTFKELEFRDGNMGLLPEDMINF